MNASDPVDHGLEVTSLLMKEHARFRQEMAELLEERDEYLRRDAFEALVHRVVQHETVEEATIYPVLAQLDGGPELRDEVLRQEREVASHLAHTMRRLVWRPRGRKTQRLVGEFSDVLERHLAFEEDSVIAAIAALEDEHKRQMMGSWAQRAESIAPTRPYPYGPQHLPGILSLGPALAIIDRMRDRGRKLVRPESPRRSERVEPTRRRTHARRARKGSMWR